MNAATYYLLVAPLGLFAAYFLSPHAPEFINPRFWEGALYGITGVTIMWAVKGTMSALRRAAPLSDSDVKIFNEQVKVMANSINAVALAFLLIAFVHPMANNESFSLKSGLLIVFGLFLHTRTYKVLECMKG